MGARGKNPTNTNITPATKRPEVVEVYAVRGFQRYVALTPKKKKKSLVVPSSAPLVVPHASGSSQQGPSSQSVSVQANTSSQVVSGQPGPSSLAVVGHGVQYSQATGGSLSHASPSHLVATYHTNHDSDSRSSIEGSFNRFLDRICFPCGHFHKDSS
ncbi:hypothetical protein EDB19DRAFT_1748560 [Suillus lakei]|nr:hypothetical protein EDB19DRAFT_1748560 [Suillus lakei]